MKKSELTEKWQKVLLPARARRADSEDTAYNPGEAVVRLRGEGVDSEFPVREVVREKMIPVTEWPKKGERK